MSKLNITICPSCGGGNIRKTRKTVTGTRQGRSYSAPGIEFYECPDCGERVYEASGLRQIEKHSMTSIKRGSTRNIA